MIAPDFSYKIYASKILHLEWAAEITPGQMHKIKLFADQLKNQDRFKWIDVVPAYHSLTIFLKDPISDSLELINSLQATYTLISEVPKESGRIWKIPVVYGGIYGPDFDAVYKVLNMKPDELIEKHTASTYDVHFIGFLPGFPYLGGLDPELHLARKDIPSASIVPGSVGIGGSQTGIYPVKSPGGWHIIGNTPFPLFDLSRKPPIVIQSTDRIQFYSIPESEMEACRLQCFDEIKKTFSS